MPTVRPVESVAIAAKKNRPRLSARSDTPRGAKKKPLATPNPHPWVTQIDRLQQGLKLNQIELATRLLNCSLRSLILWKNRRTPNPAVLLRLKELDRLYRALAELMPPEDVATWMKQTNAYLDPLTPLEVLSRGEVDRLWKIIHNVGSGMPT